MYHDLKQVAEQFCRYRALAEHELGRDQQLTLEHARFLEQMLGLHRHVV